MTSFGSGAPNEGFACPRRIFSSSPPPTRRPRPSEESAGQYGAHNVHALCHRLGICQTSFFSVLFYNIFLTKQVPSRSGQNPSERANSRSNTNPTLDGGVSHDGKGSNSDYFLNCNTDFRSSHEPQPQLKSSPSPQVESLKSLLIGGGKL